MNFIDSEQFQIKKHANYKVEDLFGLYSLV